MTESSPAFPKMHYQPTAQYLLLPALAYEFVSAVNTPFPIRSNFTISTFLSCHSGKRSIFLFNLRSKGGGKFTAKSFRVHAHISVYKHSLGSNGIHMTLFTSHFQTIFYRLPEE